MLSANIAAGFPVNTAELCEKNNGSPNCSYLCANIGDAIRIKIEIQRRYLKNNFLDFLLFKKRIKDKAIKNIIPDQWIYHNAPRLAKERYERREFFLRIKYVDKIRIRINSGSEYPELAW